MEISAYVLIMEVREGKPYVGIVTYETLKQASEAVVASPEYVTEIRKITLTVGE